MKVSRLSSGSRRLSGSEFQVDGPATEKCRRPKLFNRWYDQLSLSGRTQMLTASDFCCECTTVHQVRRSSSMETSIHEHCELKSYSVVHWMSDPQHIFRALHTLAHGLPKDWKRLAGCRRQAWLCSIEADLQPLKHELNSA